VFHGKKIVVVMPAYKAAETLERTVAEVPLDLVDEIVVTDDASPDATAEIARHLGLRVLVHPKNRGYGGNQKTCYAEALRLGADVVIMLHPDYQYTPKLIPAMVGLITDGPYDCVLGSRILGGTARAGGMPGYKYLANRLLTAGQNLLCGAKLSEYHTGYRAFRREVIERLPLAENSDDFVLPDGLLRGGVLDQLPALGHLRAGGGRDVRALLAPAARLGPRADLRPGARTSPRSDCRARDDVGEGGRQGGNARRGVHGPNLTPRINPDSSNRPD